MLENFQLNGWFADFQRQNFYFGQLVVEDNRIVEIRETGGARLTWEERKQASPLILPGLVDSHVHIESSMLMPSRFAEQAVRFGTVATVSDPHEIANVLGMDGIALMLRDAEKACIRICFTAPSCVPASPMESSGAVLQAENLAPLFSENRVVALGEMMNYPGVLSGDLGVLDKISLAKKYGKPVDGHAPGLTGEQLDRYIAAGIQTDHECSTLAEAEEKIGKGMKVLIREGSSARNFDQLYLLIDKYPGSVMLCTDDFHPDDLMAGHIDRLIRGGVSAGVNFFNIYRAASLNPVLHYRLNTGMLRPGDPADFLVASSADPFRVTETYLKGIRVFGEGKVTASLPPVEVMNTFRARPVSPKDLVIRGESGIFRIIRAVDGELVTGSETARMEAKDGRVEPDISRDILKIVVLNRYQPAKPARGFISGFGIGSGAMASSIAHDSHNIIAVGTSDDEIAAAMNLVIDHRGGISAVDGNNTRILPLPVAGLMSTENAGATGAGYAGLSDFVKQLGSPLKAPFMALSFMALLVIPHLKIGDRGLFDCDKFEFTGLKAD